MSLDVYLTVAKARPKEASSGIFIREDGRTKEISREEWHRTRGGEPTTFHSSEETTNRVFNWNITHNLNTMAEAAGIYQHLWRPDELGITTAIQLIDPLQKGLDVLVREPEKYKIFNPSNGWGDYWGLVEFVTRYLVACRENPEATISVSR